MRRNVPQLRIGGDDRPVDLVVQKAEQNVGLANGCDQSAMRNYAAVVGENLDAAKRTQALYCAVGNRLRDKDARFARSPEPPHDAGNAVDGALCAVRNLARGVEHAQHHRDASLARERSQMRR